jgi:hypothetical protein
MGKKIGVQLRGNKFWQVQDSLHDDFDNEQILTLAERRLSEEITNKITVVLDDCDSVYKEILPPTEVENSMVEHDKELDTETDDREDLTDPIGEIEDVLLSDGCIGNSKLSQLYQALRRQENGDNVVKITPVIAQTAMPVQAKSNNVNIGDGSVKMLTGRSADLEALWRR